MCKGGIALSLHDIGLALGRRMPSDVLEQLILMTYT